MKTQLHIISFVLLACLFASCSSARECSKEESYVIEYVTGGGFTGMERGMTIECSGRVTFWDRKVNAGKVTTDSLLLKSSSRKKFDEMMSDAKIFAYSHSEPGNHTATLTLTKQNMTTVIAYTSSATPADLPVSVRAILSEIQSIHK